MKRRSYIIFRKDFLKVVLLFLGLLSSNITFSQDTLKHFHLVSGQKSKKIKSNDFIHIDAKINLNGNPTTSEIIGRFQFIKGDSIGIRPVIITPDINFSSNYRSYSEKTDTIFNVNYHEISSIVYDRKYIGSIAAVTFWAAGFTALVISPLASIQKGGGFDTQKFLKISGISLGVCALSAGIIIAFDEKTFEIQPTNNKKRKWTIEK